MQLKKPQSTLGLIIGNRDFFPDKLVAEARTEILELFKKLDITPILLNDADSTKMGKASLASLGALSLIDYIITDAGIEEKHKQVFHDNEIELIIAS